MNNVTSNVEMVWVVWNNENGSTGEQEVAADMVEKTIKNIKRRKNVVKDSVMQKVDVEFETVVEEAAEDEIEPGYIAFTSVAKNLGVRYQQVFQKHNQGKLGSRKMNGKWFAKIEAVEIWQERRIKYLASQTK